MKNRISVRLEKGDRKKIEEIIKNEYPNLKNLSDVIRVALREFLLTYKKGD